MYTYMFVYVLMKKKAEDGSRKQVCADARSVLARLRPGSVARVVSRSRPSLWDMAGTPFMDLGSGGHFPPATRMCSRVRPAPLPLQAGYERSVRRGAPCPKHQAIRGAGDRNASSCTRSVLARLRPGSVARVVSRSCYSLWDMGNTVFMELGSGRQFLPATR